MYIDSTFIEHTEKDTPKNTLLNKGKIDMYVYV
jgi:hypothetical protein